MSKAKITAFFLLAFGASSMVSANGLNVCNETGEKIFVSWVSYEGGQWISRAWRNVENTACTQLSPSFANTRYYLYAVSNSGKRWGANHSFCLPNSDGVIYNADNMAICTNPKNYFSVWVPDMLTGSYPASYTHVFSGANYGENNPALNHPRAER